MPALAILAGWTVTCGTCGATYEQRRDPAQPFQRAPKRCADCGAAAKTVTPFYEEAG